MNADELKGLTSGALRLCSERDLELAVQAEKKSFWHDQRLPSIDNKLNPQMQTMAD